MIALIAALVAAPVAVSQKGPWLEMQAGPQVLLRSRGAGVGPEVRLNLGLGVSEGLAAEVWLSGAMEESRLTPGDQARLGAGLAARGRFVQFDSEGKVALWGRLGGGFTASSPGQLGPTGFAGLQVLFQPFVKRFSMGLEVDGVALRGGMGFAVLPSLRCAL